MSERMEAVIRRFPDQWYMFRQMWPRTDRDDTEIKGDVCGAVGGLRRALWVPGEAARVYPW